MCHGLTHHSQPPIVRKHMASKLAAVRQASRTGGRRHCSKSMSGTAARRKPAGLPAQQVRMRSHIHIPYAAPHWLICEPCHSVASVCANAAAQHCLREAPPGTCSFNHPQQYCQKLDHVSLSLRNAAHSDAAVDSIRLTHGAFCLQVASRMWNGFTQ